MSIPLQHKSCVSDKKNMDSQRFFWSLKHFTPIFFRLSLTFECFVLFIFGYLNFVFVYFRLGCLQFGSGRNRPVKGYFYGDTNAYRNMNGSTLSHAYLAAVGQHQWPEVSESKTDFAEGGEALTITSEENQMIVAVFSLVGFVLLNLFIVMMVNSYTAIENSSRKEVFLNKVVLACENLWIYAYYRVRIPKAYKRDLDVYSAGITKMNKLYVNDVNFIKSLVSQLCTHCFLKRCSSISSAYIGRIIM